jgi:hypothetical protein
LHDADFLFHVSSVNCVGARQAGAAEKGARKKYHTGGGD